MWYGVVCGMVWCGVVWCGVWYGVVWYGMVCSIVWYGYHTMVWSGVYHHTLYPRMGGEDAPEDWQGGLQLTYRSVPSGFMVSN